MSTVAPDPALMPDLIQAVKLAEETLGENIVWISDLADLAVRQGDREALQRLETLNRCWIALCHTLKQIEE